MIDEQPEALRLADAMSRYPWTDGLRQKAAAELRRLHAEVERLRRELALHKLADADRAIERERGAA